jgi:hypothetical protein
LEIAFGENQWPPVKTEKSYCVAGFQHDSRCTNQDSPIFHKTFDWNWDQILDPAFNYMLNYTSKRITLKDDTEYPFIENEWETGSMPLQWRPFWGEYVTVWGRHIFDAGHMPVTPEIHPGHSIVREHTTAAALGSGGKMVPANRAIIGMGLSGGFPRNIGTRWTDETGNNPPDGIWGDTKGCWATNLKNHPLRFKLFPPVPRPSKTAQLKYKIVFCQYIQLPSWHKVDDFLEFCQNNDPAEGGNDLAFRDWHQLPSEFKPQTAPAMLRPKLNLKNESYFSVEVDLTQASEIPTAYYAIIDCGWSERGNHKIYEFDVTYENVKAVETDEVYDDWHMFYGVNGQWAAWYTDDFIEEDQTYIRNTNFRVWTIDNMPLSIRDCGIEYELGFWCTDCNGKLDRVEIIAPGPNHFSRIIDDYKSKGIVKVSPGNPEQTNSLSFKAQGWKMVPNATKHEWAIKIVRRSI